MVGEETTTEGTGGGGGEVEFVHLNAFVKPGILNELVEAELKAESEGLGVEEEGEEEERKESKRTSLTCVARSFVPIAISRHLSPGCAPADCPTRSCAR